MSIFKYWYKMMKESDNNFLFFYGKYCMLISITFAFIQHYGFIFEFFSDLSL